MTTVDFDNLPQDPLERLTVLGPIHREMRASLRGQRSAKRSESRTTPTVTRTLSDEELSTIQPDDVVKVEGLSGLFTFKKWRINKRQEREADLYGGTRGREQMRTVAATRLRWAK